MEDIKAFLENEGNQGFEAKAKEQLANLNGIEGAEISIPMGENAKYGKSFYENFQFV